MRFSVVCMGCLVALSTLQLAGADQLSQQDDRAARKELKELKQMSAKLSSRIQRLERTMESLHEPETVQTATVGKRIIVREKPEEVAQTSFEPGPKKSDGTRLLTVPYKVADLVEVQKGYAYGREFDPIMRYIETKIAPEQWEGAGGPGTMAPYHANMSLVISATKEVHQQISDWLKKMREAHEVLSDFESANHSAPK